MKVSFRFVVIAALFVTTLLTANIIGSKVAGFGFVTLPAAVVLFPFSYIFGDILTEVYGYHQARRIIWVGFLCNLIFVIFAWIGQILPPASGWENQPAYEAILGYTPRLLVASFFGYLAGEFGNSFVLARMKILTKGRWLWTRTIGSTIVGQGLDTVIFILGAFWGLPFFTPLMILYHWVAKVLIEIVATPFTYMAVNTLKKTEGVDVYDTNTDFNPLAFWAKERKAISR
ncbi:MAG: queuosine precursor transporter [Dehalococcoidia bacterium]|nr:queuosine precursor transporter [Dehalococcoidia bacterium]